MGTRSNVSHPNTGETNQARLSNTSDMTNAAKELNFSFYLTLISENSDLK